jgi:hypothetical protein
MRAAVGSLAADPDRLKRAADRHTGNEPPDWISGAGLRAGLTEAPLVTGIGNVNERQTKPNGSPASSTAAVPLATSSGRG